MHSKFIHKKGKCSTPTVKSRSSKRRVNGRTCSIVYGATSKKWPLRIFLLYFNFVGYFVSSNPPLYQNRVVAIFPLACMAAFSNSKWPIYTRHRKIKLKSMSSCSSDHKDFKIVWISIRPMFGNGVMGQNVKFMT